VRTDLVETALRRGHPARESSRKAIFHIRGNHHTSEQLADACANLPVLRSMGRPRACWDDAAEYFSSTLQLSSTTAAAGPPDTKRNKPSAPGSEDRYKSRRHSTLGMISPARCEQLHTQTADPPDRVSNNWDEPYLRQT